MGDTHMEKKISLVSFVSDKMWLFLMPTKLDSWSTVWQLTFKSSSHRLNWSSLKYELLHLHHKCTVMLLASKWFFSFFLPLVGSAECHPDSWMFCLPLYHLSETHRADCSHPPMFSGCWGTHWLIPPQTLPPGSRTGDEEMWHCSNLTFVVTFTHKCLNYYQTPLTCVGYHRFRRLISALLALEP